MSSHPSAPNAARPSWRIGPEHVRFAREAVAAHLRPTPLQPLPAVHPRLWVKRETEQPTGSFKVRGTFTRMLRAKREGHQEVITASAGNHGQGVALAARRLGLRAVVHVPSATPEVKRRAIASLGATLRLVEGSYDDAEAAARQEARRRCLPFVSPFDDPWVAAGNGATLAQEVFDTLPNVAVFVLPVGGGGLLAGLAAALSLAPTPDITLIGVQSEACPAMARSLAEGRPIERMTATGPTLAEGLEGGVSVSTYEAARAAGARVQTVSERRIAEAMVWAHRHLGWTLEGSAAAALAWVLAHREALPSERPSVLVSTGGNVDPDRLAHLERASQQRCQSP